MTKHIKTIEQQYKALSQIDHILLRPGMYIGSMATHTGVEYLFDGASHSFKKKEVSYVPALCKIFNEILDNSIDEHKRNPKKLNQIKVNVDQQTGEITVWDNGGIPVVIHQETQVYVPEMIFGTLLSGSNYNDDDDQAVIGTNGIGSKASNIFSKYFIVETCDGTNNFHQEFKGNMKEKSEAKVKKGAKGYTQITFLPDYERFADLKGLDEGHFLKFLTAVVNAAGTNPQCKFFFNGERIDVKSFEDYIKLYTDAYVYEENDDWKVGISKSSEEGFESVSFVNSVNTYEGGSHILYIAEQITTKLREYFKKKHKVDVTPANLRNHLRLFISCNINRPKFDSQTKSRMISEPRDYKTAIEISDKFINKLIKSEEIIQSILDWVEAKADAAARAELRALNKTADKTSARKVVKLDDAAFAGKQPEKCMLFLAEGDSAKGAILSAADRATMGAFPLKGKPLNVDSLDGADLKKLVNNEEFKNIMISTGLQIGVEVKSINELRYGKIVFMTDADVDGLHISGLLINMFYRFWPELFKMGVIYRFITPLIRVRKGKKEVINFYTKAEFEAWAEKHANERWESKYYKGLGTSKAIDFEEYFADMDNHLIQIRHEDASDAEAIKLLFGKEAGMSDKRKDWLGIEEK